MARNPVSINRARSAERIDHDIETLAGRDYTLSSTAIRRYAYTDVYANTLSYFRRQFQDLGFDVFEDSVGTLVARNRPAGEKVFGLGSHCDSNRNGGKYDGTMGVVTALEVCRLNRDLNLNLPLQVISFLEEEGSGFGQMLLGSRIMAQRVTEVELRQPIRALDDDRSFWEHAQAAGYHPECWRDSIQVLHDLVGWIEMHIEQGRVLQDTGNRIGLVQAIAGCVHADVTVQGRADHAGATPMDLRLDAGLVAAECMLELERLARAAGNGTVGTVGEMELQPGLVNVVPGMARFSLDIRGVDQDAFMDVANRIASFATDAAQRRGMTAAFTPRQAVPATLMDKQILEAMEVTVQATGESFMRMPSGAAHDTMCVADHVPAAMIFVPCKDGISHSPLEEASSGDAALAAEVMLGAIHLLLA